VQHRAADLYREALPSLGPHFELRLVQRFARGGIGGALYLRAAQKKGRPELERP